jgi:hypothetical protein
MSRRAWEEATAKVKITDEMIDAGLSALGRFVFEFEREADAVEAIYSAMRCLAPGRRSARRSARG